MILCSACLLGIRCRYDALSKVNNKILSFLKKEILIPVCPEQLGGLSTPRECCEIRENRVVSRSGKDLTENFVKGAQETFYIAQLLNIKMAIFKQYSPSCGCGKIYDGTFTGRIIQGDGITTSFLKRNDIVVISEEEL